MNLASIETSGAMGSVALLEGNRVVAHQSFEHGLQRGRDLVPTLKKLFREVGWNPREQLDLLAVDLGPGSYTGLRVGITCAKTISYLTGAPVVGVVSLDALAENAPEETLHVCPVIDAKRNEVYSAIYARRDGALVRETEPMVIRPEELSSRLPHRTLLLGNGTPAFTQLPPQSNIEIAPQELWTVRAETIARLGLKLYESGKRGDALRLSPIYLRRPAAEEKLKATKAPHSAP